MMEQFKLLFVVDKDKAPTLDVLYSYIEKTFLNKSYFLSDEVCNILQQCASNYTISDIFDIVKGFHSTNHIPYKIEITKILLLQIIPQNINNDIKLILVSIIELLISLIINVYPVLPEHEYKNNEDCDTTLKNNILLTKKMFEFYLALLNTSHTLILKYLIKKTASQILILTSCRMGNFLWTDKDLKILSNDLLSKLLKICNEDSISSLMSGSGENDLFPNGLWNNTIHLLSKYFKKENWEKNVTIKHSFVWCLTKVKFPHLEDYINIIIPPILLMIDSYDRKEKLLGLSTLQYAIENVTPSTLLLYNHAYVIYDTLFKLLYSSNNAIYELSINTLKKILFVIEQKPHQISKITFSKWDTCFKKLLDNIQFSSTAMTRKIFLKFSIQFVQAMKGNSIKFFDDIIKAVVVGFEYPDGEKEESRLLSIKLLHESILVCWPVVPKYMSTLFKMLLKILIDLNYPGVLCNENIKNKIQDNIHEVLKLLQKCSKQEFDKIIKDLLEQDFDERFQNVSEILKKFLVYENHPNMKITSNL